MERPYTREQEADSMTNDAKNATMTPPQAIAFIRDHGVVLESAKGSVVSLAEAIAGQPIQGSWWGHAKSHQIFKLTRAVRNSQEILVCRLVEGKVSFVHRRLWASLVAAAGCFPERHLSLIKEVHTDSGHHETKEVPFPNWVPASVAEEAKKLNQAQALAELGSWTENASPHKAFNRTPEGADRSGR